jgi:hypothetical protein
VADEHHMREGGIAVIRIEVSAQAGEICPELSG